MADDEYDTMVIRGHINSRLMAEYPLDCGHAIAVECINTSSDWRNRYHYLLTHDDRVIFEGHDLWSGCDDDIDYGKAVRGILGFLTLRPGDVESDYFADYTPEQIAWRDEFAEAFALYSFDDVEYIGVEAS